MIEFNRWYLPGAELCRCLECGAILSTNDTEVHVKWHQKIGG
jgi:hypothetical protein